MDFSVEVRRSRRRTKTVGAQMVGDTLVVSIPAWLSAAEEREWVAKMSAKFAKKQARRRPSDETLARRSAELTRRYLPGGPAPSSIRWVTNQNSRWGSCNVSDGSIRLSHRMQGMPQYVVDYVILHELVHLQVPRHGPDFWAKLAGYPHLDKARGFLDGVTHGERHPESRPDESVAPEDFGEGGV